MSPEAPLDEFSREELIAQIRELVRRNAELQAEIEQLKRSQPRSAAPFSKGQPKADPKRPGRKPGQGPFLRRAAPPQPPTQTVTAQVPESCPACGGPLEQVSEKVATTTELPVHPQPMVTEYRVPVCPCRQCGQRVRGTAPGLAADQAGATAHRVGQGLMAAAHTLHYGIGVPVRKVPAILEELTGVTITQSAVTQDALRRVAGPVGAAYAGLRDAVRERRRCIPTIPGGASGARPPFSWASIRTTRRSIRFGSNIATRKFARSFQATIKES